jgi:hypothetical protein
MTFATDKRFGLVTDMADTDQNGVCGNTAAGIESQASSAVISTATALLP